MRLENAWSRKRANKSTLTNLVKMWQQRMGKVKKITNKSTSTKLGKNEVKGMGTGGGGGVKNEHPRKAGKNG